MSVAGRKQSDGLHGLPAVQSKKPRQFRPETGLSDNTFKTLLQSHRLFWFYNCGFLAIVRTKLLSTQPRKITDRGKWVFKLFPLYYSPSWLGLFRTNGRSAEAVVQLKGTGQKNSLLGAVEVTEYIFAPIRVNF